MLLVSDLNVAEDLVAKDESLMWDGWNILQLKENPQAFMKRNAIFKNNKWYSTKVFALSKNGWSVPDYMIGKVNDLQLGKSG